MMTKLLVQDKKDGGEAKVVQIQGSPCTGCSKECLIRHEVYKWDCPDWNKWY